MLTPKSSAQGTVLTTRALCGVEARSLSKEGPPTGHYYCSIRLRGFSSSHSARWSSARRSRTRQSRTQKRAKGQSSATMAAGAIQWVPMTKMSESSALKKKRIAPPMKSLMRISIQISTQPGTGLSSIVGSMSSRGRSVRSRHTYLPPPRCPANCRFIETDYTASDRTYHCRKPLWRESDGKSTDRFGTRE